MIDSKYAGKLIEELKKTQDMNCVKCGRPLVFRKSVCGFVCKNSDCENYWMQKDDFVQITLDGETMDRLYPEEKYCRNCNIMLTPLYYRGYNDGKRTWVKTENLFCPECKSVYSSKED